MIFRARHFEFRFPRPALIMGVLNVTPDSFSDGGKFFNPRKAVEHGLKLIAEGAEILDIGGESTRPNAKRVPEKEELRRVIPVIEKLAGKIGIPISIDTMKSAVARAALQAGASIVNDVAANRAEDAMWKMAAECRAGYVCMHAPPDFHKLNAQKKIVAGVADFFQARLQQMKAAGILPEQIVFDPGIGFGKTLEQNLSLVAHLRAFKKLRRPLLVGVSRKSFIGKLLVAPVNERLPASLACAILAVESGVQIIRTHDVAATVQAVRMAEALLTRRKTDA